MRSHPMNEHRQTVPLELQYQKSRDDSPGVAFYIADIGHSVMEMPITNGKREIIVIRNEDEANRFFADYFNEACVKELSDMSLWSAKCVIVAMDEQKWRLFQKEMAGLYR